MNKNPVDVKGSFFYFEKYPRTFGINTATLRQGESMFTGQVCGVFYRSI